MSAIAAAAPAPAMTAPIAPDVTRVAGPARPGLGEEPDIDRAHTHDGADRERGDVQRNGDSRTRRRGRQDRPPSSAQSPWRAGNEGGEHACLDDEREARSASCGRRKPRARWISPALKYDCAVTEDGSSTPSRGLSASTASSATRTATTIRGRQAQTFPQHPEHCRTCASPSCLTSTVTATPSRRSSTTRARTASMRRGASAMSSATARTRTPACTWSASTARSAWPATTTSWRRASCRWTTSPATPPSQPAGPRTSWTSTTSRSCGTAPDGIEGDIGLFHASPRDAVWEYVLSSSLAARCLDVQAQRLTFIGHTHIALSFSREPGKPVDGQTRTHGAVVAVAAPAVADQPWVRGPAARRRPPRGLAAPRHVNLGGRPPRHL